MHERAAAGAAAVFALLLPRTSSAHAPIEGIGDFYGGLLHPLAVPEHLIVLVTLGLLLGQHRAQVVRSGLATFACGLIAGILVVVQAQGGMALSMPLLAGALVLGLLTALGRVLAGRIVATMAAIAGGMIGVDGARDMLDAPGPSILLAGSAIGAALLVFYVAGITNCLQRQWQKVGVRIVGSWMATGALLVLVLQVARSAEVG